MKHENAEDVQRRLDHNVEVMDEIMEERIQNKETDLPLDIGLSLGGWRPENDLERAIQYVNFNYENAVSTKEISGYHYSMTSREKEMIVKDKRGYNYIFRALAKPFYGKIHFRKVVDLVHKTKNGYYQVQTTDGSCYKGKQVLVTFSSNVLTSGKVTFKPELPTWKKHALLMVPLAHYCKIFLEFKKQFWDESDHFMAVGRDTGKYSLWQNLAVPGLYPGKKLLAVTLTGDECLRSQQEDDSTVKSRAMSSLKALYGKRVTKPLG